MTRAKLSTTAEVARLIAILSYCCGLALAANPCAMEAADNTPATMNKMKITIGSATFTATLADNPTAAAFEAMLPLTLNMAELNGNEKHGDLGRKLPVDDANPGTIHAGDLMFWQGDTVVLFYKTFRTSYSYTRLGRLDDASALADAVGSANVKVRFEQN
jgi:hypothetical protein